MFYKKWESDVWSLCDETQILTDTETKTKIKIFLGLETETETETFAYDWQILGTSRNKF